MNLAHAMLMSVMEKRAIGLPGFLGDMAHSAAGYGRPAAATVAHAAQPVATAVQHAAAPGAQLHRYIPMAVGAAGGFGAGAAADSAMGTNSPVLGAVGGAIVGANVGHFGAKALFNQGLQRSEAVAGRLMGSQTGTRFTGARNAFDLNNSLRGNTETASQYFNTLQSGAHGLSKGISQAASTYAPAVHGMGIVGTGMAGAIGTGAAAYSASDQSKGTGNAVVNGMLGAGAGLAGGLALGHMGGAGVASAMNSMTRRGGMGGVAKTEAAAKSTADAAAKATQTATPQTGSWLGNQLQGVMDVNVGDKTLGAHMAASPHALPAALLGGTYLAGQAINTAGNAIARPAIQTVGNIATGQPQQQQY